MAHNDGPFAAARRQIASREATPAAEPADALPRPRRRADATVGGIPVASAIPLPANYLRAESAPNQHIPFAFWLVRLPTPPVFAELSTFRDHARPTRVFPRVFAHGRESVASATRCKHERKLGAVGARKSFILTRLFLLYWRDYNFLMTA
jgi:hypothetical protein